ncbi:MAG: anthranilate phosphoribosyltransferase, partial [Brevinematia bacterium]
DPIPIDEIKGGDIEYNKKILLDILNDKDIPQKNAVIMNSAMGIMISGLAKNLQSAVDLAKKSISSGKALEKLEKLIELSNKN